MRRGNRESKRDASGNKRGRLGRKRSELWRKRGNESNMQKK
jgi:hypothetical protein